MDLRQLLTTCSYIENQSKGTNITHKVTAPAGQKLCFGTVEWIHEDTSNGATGKPDPFAKFLSSIFNDWYSRNG